MTYQSRHPTGSEAQRSAGGYHAAAGHYYEDGGDEEYEQPVVSSGLRASNYGLAAVRRRKLDRRAASGQPSLDFSRVQKDSVENDDEDGLVSPRRVMQQMGAFNTMVEGGADWGSALVHALQGHKMTEDQAAIVLQSAWRRHEAVVLRVARELAAEHMREAYREKLMQEQQLEEELMARDEEAYMEYDAATKLNAVWRGHLARGHVASLRAERSKSLRRSFSFGKRRASKATATTPSRASQSYEQGEWGGHVAGLVTGAALAPVLVEAATSVSSALFSVVHAPVSGAQRVRRSMSFDRKGGGGGLFSGGGSSKAAEKVNTSCTRRTFVLERGPQGLGIELDATNTVVTIKHGGRAERQGLLAVHDTILTIDGKSCSGLLMQDVMVPGRPVYVTEVSRPNFDGASPKRGGFIRRSLRFDTKRQGGVKRSFSFERKR
jgi:hypothetical protein